MIVLHDIRESKVWKEAYAEGFEIGLQIARDDEKGCEEGRTSVRQELVWKKLAKGMSLEAIADLMELSVDDVRRLAKEKAT